MALKFPKPFAFSGDTDRNGKGQGMNRGRRKKIQEVCEKIREAIESLEEIKEEEQGALDNLPDSFRYGERGEEMEGYIEMLDETLGYLDDAGSVLDQI